MLKFHAVEKWKPLKYRWLKENDIEMQQVLGHVAASYHITPSCCIASMVKLCC
jgi:hypothetical protein